MRVRASAPRTPIKTPRSAACAIATSSAYRRSLDSHIAREKQPRVVFVCQRADVPSHSYRPKSDESLSPTPYGRAQNALGRARDRYREGAKAGFEPLFLPNVPIWG